MRNIAALSQDVIKALGQVSIDELAIILRNGLCDYHVRVLVAGLVCPIEQQCDHDHSGDVDRIDSALQIMKARRAEAKADPEAEQESQDEQKETGER